MWFVPFILATAVSSSVASSESSVAPIPRDDAKPTIELGDGAINGESLKPYENAWRVTLHKKDGSTRQAGIWTETLATRELNGRKVFWWTSSDIVYTGDDLSKMSVYTNLNIVDFKTLAPIRSWHHFSNTDIQNISVDGTHVEISHSTSDSGPKEITRFVTPKPVYDLEGGFWAVVVPALKLDIGNSGVIPGVGDKDMPVKGYPFRVVRQEKLKAGVYGVVDTKVVEVYEPRTKELFTFWVIDKPPYVMRFTVPGDDYDQSFDELGTDGPIDWGFAR